MKRAFTLIEMLIVVVVLVTLMAIAFKLSSIGSDENRRITTVTRLQRLENCLSGYNAAFGSYPAVKLHASRDIYLKTDEYGRQSDNESETELKWESIEAACRAQPFGLACPFPNNNTINERITQLGEFAYENAQSGNWANAEKYKFEPMNSSNFSGEKNKTEWNDVQLYRFGVMSFLLPRYLVMMDGERAFLDYAQWLDNNSLPCNPWTGERFNSWYELSTNANAKADTQAQIKNIPSQAVTARWMPNLQGICTSRPRVLFGINLTTTTDGYSGGLLSRNAWDSESSGKKIHSIGGYNSTSSNYILDEITVEDGWEQEFYYYSLPPYQSYTLWSAGANGKTFPPWMDLGMLKSDTDRRQATTWMQDDIIQMRN